MHLIFLYMNLGVGVYIFMFSGFKYLTLVSTITIFQTGPLIVIIFSVIFFSSLATSSALAYCSEITVGVTPISSFILDI